MGKILTNVAKILFILMIISIIIFFTSKSPMWLGISFLGFIVSLFILLICGAVMTGEKQGEYYRENYFRKHHICNNCRYEWMSKKTVGRPSKCPHCNSKNIDRYEKIFCPSCNVRIEPDDTFCPECGKTIKRE